MTSTTTEPFTLGDRIEVGDIARRVGLKWPTGKAPMKRSVADRMAKRIVRMRDAGEKPYISDARQTFAQGVRFNYQEN
ncbi:hypothetical protein [Gordonia humi]|uniref:Uncharacterized protein n=1 Tax=Gordonia humi TaxID=686429 RepID=A0A840F782_9ACTN|nr:hypothetical protein [Gordonia humi]MBB4136080.1 hypothetical protein [Gordonia humi]